MIGERGKALTLFRPNTQRPFGLDTLEVASRLNVTEAVALKWVSEQRSAALQLPSPYEIRALARSA
jgi:hypothetical protein